MTPAADLCAESARLLSLEEDARPERAALEQARAHLARCAACTERHGDDLALALALASVVPSADDARRAARAAARVAERARDRTRAPRRIGLAAAAVVLAAAAVLVARGVWSPDVRKGTQGTPPAGPVAPQDDRVVRSRLAVSTRGRDRLPPLHVTHTVRSLVRSPR